MKLIDYTTESAFLPQIKCDDVAAAVARLVDGLAAAGEVADPAALVADVMHREREGSTAIGGGLVIPHARSAQVDRVHVGVATLARPVAADSLDGRPVDLVILLVGPDGDPRLMLRVLARLARLVKQDDFLAGLRAAADVPALRLAFSLAGETGL